MLKSAVPASVPTRTAKVVRNRSAAIAHFSKSRITQAAWRLERLSPIGCVVCSLHMSGNRLSHVWQHNDVHICVVFMCLETGYHICDSKNMPPLQSPSIYLGGLQLPGASSGENLHIADLERLGYFGINSLTHKNGIIFSCIIMQL